MFWDADYQHFNVGISIFQGRSRQKNRRRPVAQPPSKGRLLIGQIHKTITHYFPDLFDRLDGLVDPRAVGEDVSLAVGGGPLIPPAQVRLPAGLRVRAAVRK